MGYSFPQKSATTRHAGQLLYGAFAHSEGCARDHRRPRWKRPFMQMVTHWPSTWPYLRGEWQVAQTISIETRRASASDAHVFLWILISDHYHYWTAVPHTWRYFTPARGHPPPSGLHGLFGHRKRAWLFLASRGDLLGSHAPRSPGIQYSRGGMGAQRRSRPGERLRTPPPSNGEGACQ